jgi:hypothetical protein
VTVRGLLCSGDTTVFAVMVTVGRPDVSRKRLDTPLDSVWGNGASTLMSRDP